LETIILETIILETIILETMILYIRIAKPSQPQGFEGTRFRGSKTRILNHTFASILPVLKNHLMRADTPLP
jgi:hypothetical protein